MLTYDMTGKVALVTGGAQGMGRAIAYAFADAGCSVVVADVSVAGGEETVATIRNSGGAAAFQSCDVADAIQVERLVSFAVSTFGRIDYAVNAAAIEGESAPLAELDDDLFDRIQDVNVRSVYLCMKHEINAMLAIWWRGHRQHCIDQQCAPAATSVGVHRQQACGHGSHEKRGD